MEKWRPWKMQVRELESMYCEKNEVFILFPRKLFVFSSQVYVVGSHCLNLLKYHQQTDLKLKRGF
jgi:hypothetical protein